MVGNAKVFVLAVAEMVAYLHISTIWPGYSMSVQGDNVRTVVKAEFFEATIFPGRQQAPVYIISIANRPVFYESFLMYAVKEVRHATD